MSVWSLVTCRPELGDGRSFVAVADAEGRVWRHPTLTRYPDVRAALRDWQELKSLLVGWQASFGEPVDAVRITAPLPEPSKLVFAGANYPDHLAEMGIAEVPANLEPYFFLLPPSAIIGPGEPVVIPEDSDARVDWEAELGVVIGQRTRRVTADQALEAVAGYTIVNDVSARGLHARRNPLAPPFAYDWLSSKGRDTFSPIGPGVVPAWFVPDPQSLPVRLWRNGVLEQDGNTKDMIFGVAELIAAASELMTLEPGDVLATGTPAGVGAGKGASLKAGDEMRIEIEPIGSLSNPVRSALQPRSQRGPIGRSTRLAPGLEHSGAVMAEATGTPTTAKHSTFAPLFEPMTLGKRAVRNRIFQAPMSVSYGNADGSVSDQEIEHYARRAQGGTGVVITENFAINVSGRQMPLQTLVSDEAQLPGLRRLAEEIHRHGALAVVQIVHSGRYAGPWEEYESRRRLAPSAVPFELTSGRTVTPQEIAPEEIEETLEAFVRAAQFCERAGFDGVHVHAAQGFLISGFLSPRTNHRTDEWGGDFAGRTRFALEAVRRIVASTSSDFIVGVHLLSDELVEGGWTIEDAVRLAPLLEAEGADFLFAIPSTFETMRLPANAGLINRPGYSLADTEALTRSVRIPVVANGKLGEPDEAARVLEEGQASAIALARPLFVDPDWPRKVAAGSPKDLRTCPCDQGHCLRTQLTGAVCDHWPEAAKQRGFMGYNEEGHNL